MNHTKKKTKTFKIIGMAAHTAKPGKMLDTTKIVKTGNIVDAYFLYRNKLRGVKKFVQITIRES